MSPRSIRRAHARRIARDQRQALLRRRRELAAGIVGAALLAPGAAQAAPLTVMNTNDNGAGSLRDALNTANGNNEADVITFDPSVTGTITLTTGELPISTDTHDLTITGPGRGVLTISGNDASRIFNVSTNNTPKIAISGLTLTHAAGSGNGGAISVGSGGNLSLSDVAITHSTATSEGGGVFTNGDFTLTDSTISGNSAGSGGGLYLQSNGSNMGRSTLTNVDISSNHATSGIGGGLAMRGKYMTLANSTVTGNTATGAGGGIQSSAKYGIDIKTTAISGNTAPDGGGIWLGTTGIKYATDHLTDSTVSGNTGAHGGGVYVSSISSGSKLTVSRTTVSGNTGGDNSFGGGILVAGEVYGHFDLVDSTVSGNTATAGGGVSIGSDSNNNQIGSYQGQTGTIDLDNSTISGNTAAAHGGGIYLSSYDSGNPVVRKSATAGITSTIVAGNTGSDLDRADNSTLGGFNAAFSLIQAPGDAPLLAQQALLTGVDAQLGALADNGGPTKTMLPAGTSPVIDQGKSPASLKTDQRGLARLVDSGLANAAGGDGTDIGAVELAADQVVLPPPPPKATFNVSVRGKSISPGTPLVPASLLPFDCSVTVVTMTGCNVELRSIKAYKISKKTTIAKGTLLAEGAATSSAGTDKLSLKVKLTGDGKTVLRNQPVGVDTLVGAIATTGTTDALTGKGAVHLLAGPSVTLGLGKRTTKLPSTTNKRLDQLAKLIPDAKTVTCTAYSDKGKGDVTLTKKQAKAACDRLVKDGIKATVKSSGKGHAKPVASNKTKKGRALNRRIVITFTL